MINIIITIVIAMLFAGATAGLIIGKKQDKKGMFYFGIGIDIFLIIATLVLWLTNK